MLYFDSSVWLSFILQDKHAKKADELFKRAEKNGDIIILSTLSILEVMEVIRKRVTERERFSDLTSKSKTEIENKVNEKIRRFIDETTRLEKLKRLLVINPSDSLDTYLKEVLRLFASNFGDIDKSTFCFVCNHDIPARYRYVGVGHYDLQHAINAKECAANEIASLDKGFSQLKKITDFSSLTITVM